MTGLSVNLSYLYKFGGLACHTNPDVQLRIYETLRNEATNPAAGNVFIYLLVIKDS